MNSKHCQIILFLFYTMVSFSSFLFVIRVMGITISVSHLILITTGWIFYCILSGPSLAAYYLFRHAKARLPTTAEGEILDELFGEVQRKSGFSRSMRKLVIESDEPNAFAIGSRTIAISKGILEEFSTDEIKGILAHEMGHLESGDCRYGLAFSTARIFPGAILRFRPKKRKTLRIVGIIALALKYGTWLLVLIFILYQNAGPAMVAVIFILFPKFEQMCCWAWISATRFREYRQDAFAHSLGYGQFLLSALIKLSSSGISEVNLYQIIMRHNHPMIYNRIRRLEKLVGNG